MSSINNSGNVGGPARPDATASDTVQPSTVQAQQLQAALPRIALDTNDVQKDVTLLLQRAGLERTADGSMVVKDTASVGRTGETKGLSAAEQIYGSSETQLKPPGPPRIEFTQELRRGAEAFAQNIDTALNEALLKPSATTLAFSPTTLVTPDAHRAVTDKMVAPSPVAPTTVGVKAGIDLGATTSATDAANAAKSLAGLSPDQFRQLTELTADVLLAAFLKLNITDPNNNVDTQNKLQEIMTTLRQKGIEDAKAQIKNAEELRKSAEAYAQQAQYISTVISVVMIVLSLVLAALTGGAAAVLVVAVCMVVGMLVGGMIGGKDGAMTGISIGGAIGSFGAGAAAQAAATAAKEAANQVVKFIQEFVKNLVNNLVKQLTQIFAKQSAEAAGQAAKTAVTKAVNEAVTKALQEAAKQANTTVEKLAQQTVQQITEQVTQQVLSNTLVGLQASGVQVTESMVKELTEGAVQGAVDAAKQAGFTLAEDVVKTMTQNITQAVTQDLANAFKPIISQNTANAIKTLFGSVGEVGKAEANKTATEKMLESQEAEVQAKRMRLIAEMAQEQIEQSGEIIKMIMESKNNMVDSVIKMMNAMFASSQKLMSAGMAK